MKNKERLKRGLPLIYCWQCQHRGSDISCPMCHEEDYYCEDLGWESIYHDRTIDDGFCDRGELDEEYCRELEKKEDE
jgi:hypothetical protein